MCPKSIFFRKKNEPVKVASPLHVAPQAPPRDVLADVEVPLTLIRPSNDPPLLVFDSGVVRVNLYKTENKPQPDVSVWLLTVINSSTTHIDVSHGTGFTNWFFTN